MKIIKPYVEQMTPPIDGAEFLKRIERAGRICYKSEKKITDESAPAFVANLIKNGHEAMIEHAENISMKFVCDRGVSHEIVRHRLFSFAQESTRYCVAGDSVLTFKNPRIKMTIQDLYKNIQDSQNNAWKRLSIKQLNENTGELIFEKIQNVFKNGERQCYRIVTDLGYELVCTEDHEILTDAGYVRLKNLSVGDTIYVNGRNISTADLYKDYDWLYYQSIALNKTFVQISEEFNFNVTTLKKWARKLNIPKKGTGYFNEGREPWNKGLSESDDIRVKKQADALREYHYDNSKKGQAIMKEDTSEYQKHIKDYCEVCGVFENLEVHHKNKKHNDNSPTNLFTCCESCHQRIHSNNLEIIYLDRIVDIHSCGKLPVYDLEMHGDFHNYAANGIIVHNCNYGKADEITVIEPCFWHQGNSAEYIKWSAWASACEESERVYLELLEKGATPQEARSVLPTSLKTEIIVTGNLREWRHFFKLRTATDAHPQMQEVANMALAMLKEQITVVFDDI